MTQKKPSSKPQEANSTTIVIKGTAGDVAGGDINKDNVYIGGDVNAAAGAQVALGGKGTTQTITKSGLTQEDLAGLRAELAPLREKLAVTPLPAAEKQAAEAKVAELEQELTVADRKPKATTLMYVGDWLCEHVPDLASTVATVFLGPIVGKVVSAAGDLAADWVKERFDKH